MKQFIKLQE